MIMRALLLAFGLGSVAATQASYVPQFTQSGATVSPLIVAGAPPDSPANRVDPNVPASPFAGVVSINIRYDGLSFICSGAAISPVHVLTAAHCVDTVGNGTVIDLTKPGSEVRVVVNNDSPFSLITASQVFMHSDYQGFGICPDGSFGCVNDDLAILRLSEALPSGTPIYQIHDQPVIPGALFTLVGYGTSGDGLNGYTVSPDFFIKRVGANIFDLIDTDDEQNFDPNSPAEVWYYDFDGVRSGFLRDTFCILGLACSAILNNNVETHLGGGDSGGPAFVKIGDQYFLVANNTFGINFCYSDDNPCVSGDFGDAGGGVLLYSYLSWIRDAMIVPEPGTLGLLALGLLGLSTARRRRR